MMRGWTTCAISLVGVFFVSGAIYKGRSLLNKWQDVLLQSAGAAPNIELKQFQVVDPATRTTESILGNPANRTTERQQTEPNDLGGGGSQNIESKRSNIAAGPISRICARRKKDTALDLFCERASGYPEIWEIGKGMLGEASLHDFVKHWKAARGTLMDKPIQVWYDARDTKGLGMFQEQLRDVYDLKNLLKDAAGKWFLDFGGNLGFTAIGAALRAPDAHVLTIEPSPWNYLLLRANLAQAKLHNKVVAIRGGLGGEHGVLQGVHSFVQSAGVHLSVGERSGAHIEGKFEATVYTLKDFIQTYSINDIVFVKLDCESCEWSAVRAWLKEGLYERMPIIHGEFHHKAWKRGLPVKDWEPHLSLEDARSVYQALCLTRPSVSMRKGCAHPKTDPLSKYYKLQANDPWFR